MSFFQPSLQDSQRRKSQSEGCRVFFDTSKIKIHIFENLTSNKETCFVGTLNDVEGKEFSDLSVMVFNQYELNSYINFS